MTLPGFVPVCPAIGNLDVGVGLIALLLLPLTQTWCLPAYPPALPVPM